MMSAEEDEEHDRLLERRSSPSFDSNDEAITKQPAASPSLRMSILLLSLTFLSSGFAAGYFHTMRRNAAAANAIDWNDNGTPYDDDDDGSLHLFNASFVEYLTAGLKSRLVTKENGKKVKYRYDSPYEERMPGSGQPYWAKKIVPYNRHITSDKQICFVHVGKTGGSTVGCMLGFSLHCDSNNGIQGLLPIVTTHAFHRGVDDCADNAAYYLFVVRDPLSRMLSDMNYERPDMTEDEPFSKKFHTKELYQDCNFWTLENLAQNGLLNSQNDKQSKRCRNRANDAMTGTGNYLVHGFFNYQYYSEFIWPRAEDNDDEAMIPEGANLLVIRNKHMVDDWNSIDKLIGGPRSEALKPSDIPVNNAHAKNATEIYLSESSKIALCQALCNEIQVYKDIIRRAINLNQDDIKQTIKELHETCPGEAARSSCLEKRPDIRDKVDCRRGELNQ